MFSEGWIRQPDFRAENHRHRSRLRFRDSGHHVDIEARRHLRAGMVRRLGELVYNLIRIEQMRKSETDRREDFDDVYNFDNAFEPEFQLAAPEDE